MRPHQRTLFGDGEPFVDPAASFERVWLDAGSWVDVARLWLHGADSLLDVLVASVDWRQGRRHMYDRLVDDPRLSRWYPPDADLPHPSLSTMRSELVRRYGVAFGGPGLNYYRDGRDSVAFHRDRELRELRDTRIAIVTLGVARPFLIRPVGGGPSLDLHPGAGDLLVMGGRTQMAWEHGVPKSSVRGPRLSISWRWSCSGAPGSVVRAQSLSSTTIS